MEGSQSLHGKVFYHKAGIILQNNFENFWKSPFFIFPEL